MHSPIFQLATSYRSIFTKLSYYLHKTLLPLYLNAYHNSLY